MSHARMRKKLNIDPRCAPSGRMHGEPNSAPVLSPPLAPIPESPVVSNFPQLDRYLTGVNTKDKESPQSPAKLSK